MRTANDYRKRVSTIPADASVHAAARRMHHDGVGCLVVVDGSERALGMVTDRDLLLRAVATSSEPARLVVEDVATKPLVEAAPTLGLAEVLRTMVSRGVRRIPVVEDGALVGMVSLDDVLFELARELGDLASEAPARFRVAPGPTGFERVRHRIERHVGDLRSTLEQARWFAERSIVEGLDELRFRIRELAPSDAPAPPRTPSGARSEVTQELVEEHELVLDVVDALSRLVEAGSRTGELDREDATAAIDFLREYAFGYHNEKEDRVLYAALVESGFDTDHGPVAAMRDEHRRADELLARVTRHLDAAASGHEPQLFELAADASTLARVVRDHIAKEDELVFETVGRLLSPAAAAGVVEGYRRVHRKHDGARLAEVRERATALCEKYGVRAPARE